MSQDKQDRLGQREATDSPGPVPGRPEAWPESTGQPSRDESLQQGNPALDELPQLARWQQKRLGQPRQKTASTNLARTRGGLAR